MVVLNDSEPAEHQSTRTRERDPERSSLHLVLPADMVAPTAARHAVEQHLDQQVCPKTSEKMRLLVTELVANSVRHAACGPGDTIRLNVRTHDDEVSVCVHDDGPGFKPEFRRDYEHGGGFGLYLVHQLAKRWGVHCNGQTNVWFEIARFQDRAPLVVAG